jgi:hypothetical protein
MQNVQFDGRMRDIKPELEKPLGRETLKYQQEEEE